MKSTQLILMFFLLITTEKINAQDKYEFMIIEYSNSLKNEIHISINGKEYIKDKADFSTQEKSSQNINPLLNKITEYQEKGWEFISFGNGVAFQQGTYIVYMKKKVAQK